MLCEYLHTNSESFAQICVIFYEIQNFFYGIFLMVHPVCSDEYTMFPGYITPRHLH